MTVSNEVLAERIEGFTRQNLAESQQVRRDLTSAIETMGRVQDSLTALGEHLTRHEQLDGHPIGIHKVGLLEKDASKARHDIEQLRELVTLKTEVAQLKVTVEEVRGKQKAQDSYKEGRQSALSTAEKVILLAVATSGPILAILGKVGA